MNARPLVAASLVTLAALGAAGCDRPATSAGYNNTGNSAAPDPDRQRPSTDVAQAPQSGSSVTSESLDKQTKDSGQPAK